MRKYPGNIPTTRILCIKSSGILEDWVNIVHCTCGWEIIIYVLGEFPLASGIPLLFHHANSASVEPGRTEMLAANTNAPNGASGSGGNPPGAIVSVNETKDAHPGDAPKGYSSVQNNVAVWNLIQKRCTNVDQRRIGHVLVDIYQNLSNKDPNMIHASVVEPRPCYDTAKEYSPEDFESHQVVKKLTNDKGEQFEKVYTTYVVRDPIMNPRMILNIRAFWGEVQDNNTAFIRLLISPQTYPGSRSRKKPHPPQSIALPPMTVVDSTFGPKGDWINAESADIYRKTDNMQWKAAKNEPRKCRKTITVGPCEDPNRPGETVDPVAMAAIDKVQEYHLAYLDYLFRNPSRLDPSDYEWLKEKFQDAGEELRELSPGDDVASHAAKKVDDIRKEFFKELIDRRRCLRMGKYDDKINSYPGLPCIEAFANLLTKTKEGEDPFEYPSKELEAFVGDRSLRPTYIPVRDGKGNLLAKNYHSFPIVIKRGDKVSLDIGFYPYRQARDRDGPIYGLAITLKGVTLCRRAPERIGTTSVINYDGADELDPMTGEVIRRAEGPMYKHTLDPYSGLQVHVRDAIRTGQTPESNGHAASSAGAAASAGEPLGDEDAIAEAERAEQEFARKQKEEAGEGEQAMEVEEEKEKENEEAGENEQAMEVEDEKNTLSRKRGAPSSETLGDAKEAEEIAKPADKKRKKTKQAKKKIPEGYDEE